MIAVELAKQWRRPRTVLTLAVLAGFALVLIPALQLTGADRAEPVGDIPIWVLPAASGLALPVIALASTMKFLLPLAVAIFAGEAVAGEASWGSLRYVLGRGVSRTRLLASKTLVGALLSLTAVVLVPLTALAGGLLVHGWHPLLTFPPGDALVRLSLATAYVAAGMTSIFAFALLLSTVTRQPLVAVAGGVGLTILSRVLNADYLPGVAVLSPYLPNNDVDLWLHLFQTPARTEGMVHFLALQAVYTIAFGGAAWWWFARRDIP